MSTDAPTSTLEAGNLEIVLDFLEAHPHLHNQRKWACGTTGCIAGWTIALFDHDVQAGQNMTDALGPDNYFIEDRATELLGLNYRQATALFRETANAYGCPEKTAIRLGRAMIAQSKDELTEEQDKILDRYWLR